MQRMSTCGKSKSGFQLVFVNQSTRSSFQSFTTKKSSKYYGETLEGLVHANLK